MFLMEIKLDTVKIKKEGIYNVEEIEKIIDREVTKDNLYFHGWLDGAKQFAAPDDDDELGRMLAFITRIKHIKIFVENVDIWNLITIEEENREERENVIAQIRENMKNGERYY